MFTLELDDLPIMQLLQDQVGRYGKNGGTLTDVKIMGLFDSPLELDQAPYQNSEYSAGLADRVQKLTELLEIGDQVDQDCLGGEGDAWKCVFGEFFLKYQTYPSVVLADLYDTRQLTAQLGYSYGSTFNWNTLNIDQKDYCDTFADETRAYLDDFTFPNVDRVNGFRGAVFSPSCGTHQSTMSDRYFTLRTGESGDLAVTYANTVVNDAISMVFGEQTFNNYDCSGASCRNGVLMVEDTCDGYQCSPYCNPSYGEDGITEPYVEQNPVSPQAVRTTFGNVDIMNYIIIGAAAGGCLLISTLICLFVKCMRKGSDLVQPSPEVSVEHHDTEMSNRDGAALHSASDFDANQDE